MAEVTEETLGRVGIRELIPACGLIRTNRPACFRDDSGKGYASAVADYLEYGRSME